MRAPETFRAVEPCAPAFPFCTSKGKRLLPCPTPSPRLSTVPRISFHPGPSPAAAIVPVHRRHLPVVRLYTNTRIHNFVSKIFRFLLLLLLFLLLLHLLLLFLLLLLRAVVVRLRPAATRRTRNPLHRSIIYLALAGCLSLARSFTHSFSVCLSAGPPCPSHPTTRARSVLGRKRGHLFRAKPPARLRLTRLHNAAVALFLRARNKRMLLILCVFETFRLLEKLTLFRARRESTPYCVIDGDAAASAIL